jgi:ABC-2 type transport system ATP-binding protein
MAEPVVETRELTVYYGRQRGIENVDLTVEPGEVYGFLGPNGAGKTTTLRVLLDVIRPTAGSASLFGLDSRRGGPRARARVGYLPGELSLPGHLTANQFFDVLAGTRGVHDPAWRRELCQRLNLDAARRIRQFSRGNKQKVGLVAALLHKPELLILDEPTTGLDPLVQRTVLELVRETRAAGRTVFFSSHILSEVQAVCDRVGVIRDGKLIAVERVDALVRQTFRRLRLTLANLPPEPIFSISGVRELERADSSVTLEITGAMQQVMEMAVRLGLRDVEEQPVTLEEIFMAYYGRVNGGRNG